MPAEDAARRGDHILRCCNNLEWKVIAIAPCGRMLSSQEYKVSGVRQRVNKREIECAEAGQYGHTHTHTVGVCERKSWDSGKSGERRKIEADPSSQSQGDISHSNKCLSHWEPLNPALISPGHFSLGHCPRARRHMRVCVCVCLCASVCICVCASVRSDWPSHAASVRSGHCVS